MTTPTPPAPDDQGQPSAQTGEGGGQRIIWTIAHVSHGRSELVALVYSALTRATGSPR